MEAPEKIFICDYGSELGFEWHSESDWEHQGSNDIEYTRTDAFIEKACGYLNRCLEDTKVIDDYRDILVPGIQARYTSVEEFIEDFKNYMKVCMKELQ